MLIVINLCIYHIHRKARKEVCIMEKKPPETLPDAELDVMMALWDIGRPAIVSEIHRAVSKKRKCTKTAVHVLLDRLAGKDFVSIRTIDAPTPYKVVTPLVTRDEYSSAASDSFISRIFAGKWQGPIANLVDAGKITDDDIAEIERIIGEGTKK